jgi:hypothetical protein
MANSTTNLDTIAVNQSNKEAVANALFDAASQCMTWGRHASACSGLTWGYYGGMYGANLVANGTVTLTASTTNYLYASATTGAVSVNTTGVPGGAIPLYSIVTGTTTVTSYSDLRSFLPTSQNSGGGVVNESANTVQAGPASGSPAAPTFRALVPADYPAFVASGSSHARGAVPDPGATAGTSHYLREDGTWVLQPVDLLMFFPGAPSGAGVLARLVMTRAVIFPASLTGSYASSTVAATAAATITIARNGTSIGTINFAAAATAGTFTFASAVTTAAGDVITLTNQATADATLANISVSLTGTR